MLDLSRKPSVKYYKENSGIAVKNVIPHAKGFCYTLVRRHFTAIDNVQSASAKLWLQLTPFSHISALKST